MVKKSNFSLGLVILYLFNIAPVLASESQKPSPQELISTLWPDLPARRDTLTHEHGQSYPCPRCSYERYLQILGWRTEIIGEAARIYTPGNVKELHFIITNEYPQAIKDISPEETATNYLAFHNLITGRTINAQRSDYDKKKLQEEVTGQYYQLLAEELIKEKLCS